MGGKKALWKKAQKDPFVKSVLGRRRGKKKGRKTLLLEQPARGLINLFQTASLLPYLPVDKK